MRAALSNKVFLRLVAIIFTLAMGFNFVSLFSYYITIFYLYGGDATAAGRLLGVTGTVWAITALVAVFPLNWLSKALGKNKTLLISILLMCAAQLSKIVCYNPQLPYLILIPTVLLSAGMLMFFTLGSSMVGDICDEDELNTGTRSEGTYYSVFWWFIKMGTAFASFVTGALLVFTSFDEKQNVTVDTLSGNIVVIKAETERWLTQEVEAEARIAKFVQEIDNMITNADKLRAHFVQRIEDHPDQADHISPLIEHVDAISSKAKDLRARSASAVATPQDLVNEIDELLQQTNQLKQQAPQTLFRLRLVEIGLPLLLSIVSILLTLRYPLTEARCYEIKEALKKRHAELAT